MKRKILILLAVVVGIGTAFVPQTAQAIEFSISVGDRPYYHGAHYWHNGYRWVWVPGYYSQRRHRWVPGHYVRRGGYRAEFARRHFRHHRVWVERDWR